VTTPVCCTGIISRECIEAFSIPESVIYRWAKSAYLFSPTMKPLHVWRDSPQVAILNRPAFNVLWAERAQSAGAEFSAHSEVRKIQPNRKSVMVDFLHHGEMQKVQARAVVITTGFGSWLLDSLGFKGAGDFVMGAQTEVEMKGINEVEVYFGSKIAPSFFAWLVPTTNGKAMAGVLSRRNPPAYLRNLLSRLRDEGKIKPGELSFIYGGVPLKPLSRTYGERILVVGTAAGQVKPITGGGIYFGLICADIAANTLNRCLSSDILSADKLSSYQRGWKRRLGRELRNGYWARRLFEKLDDRQLDRVFKIIETSGLIDELRKAEELSFDSHADVISRIFNHRLLLRLFRSMKLPFHLEERLRRGLNT